MIDGMAGVSARVVSLIDASGMSRRAFGVKVGLDESKLSKSLSGVRRFSSLDLTRIADECQVTVDWLITGEEPALAVAARSTGGHAGSALQLARRYCALRADLATLGHAQPAMPALPAEWAGPPAEQGQRLAVAALDALTLAGRSPAGPDLIEAVEEVFGIDVAVEPLGDGFDGVAAASPEARLIVLATSHVPGRQRFTLAHELGHLIAGDDQEVHLDRDIDSRTPSRDPSELRANAFASAFLMPEEVLRLALKEAAPGADALTFATLACDLRVTPAALACRLQALGLAAGAVFDRLRTLTGARAAALAGRGEQFSRLVAAAGTRRPPGLLVRDTYAAYESGQATLRPYANLLGVDVDELRDALGSDRGAGLPAS
jgi:Zn-dependent peptidase ImmA (M78 family)